MRIRQQSVNDNRPRDTKHEREPRSRRRKDRESVPKAPKENKPLDGGMLRLRAFSFEKARQSGGVFLILFSIYLLFAFLSHLIHAGTADASVLQSYSGQAAVNSGGYFGAWFSNLFISDGFGLISLCLPFYFFLLGYSLLENRFWELARFTFPYLFFSLYWFSGSLAYIKLVFDLPFTDLGGGLGISMNEWIAQFIGRVGTGLLLALSVLLFLQVKMGAKIRLFSRVGELFARWDQSLAPNETYDPAEMKRSQTSTAPNFDNTTQQNTAVKSPFIDEEEDKEEFFFVRRPIPVSKNIEERETDESDLKNLDNEYNYDTEPTDPEHDELDSYETEEESLEPQEAVNSVSHEKDKTNQAEKEKPQKETELKKNVPKEKLNDEPDFEISVAAGDPELDFFEERAMNGAPEEDFEANQPLSRTFSYLKSEPEDDDKELDLSARHSMLPFQPDEYTIVNAKPKEEDGNKLELDILPEDAESLSDEEAIADFEAYDPKKDLSRYKYPTLDLLNVYEAPNVELDETEKKSNMEKIRTTLGHYGVEIQRITATVGPTVTLYEIVPAPGNRISKIKNLEDDIALSLAAQGIRIIAPMPGKGTIGIEIANANPGIVSLRNVLATEKFRDTTFTLPVALGRTISNEVFLADLSKMPHLLVAGATGQGKSVGLNSLIASILFKKHPSQVKFVLIDPKKVEMNLYQVLERHFLAKLPGLEEAVITDNSEVIRVLNSLCIEMDERYELLKNARVRHISEYNEKFVNRRLNPKAGHRYLPYIVVIIDELADLMLTAGKEIEAPITRLAQLARAIGIHLVLATQRPSVNVITGIIKANFPVRISYRVMQKVDSRTILDTNGADQLIGKGDMLVSINGEVTRIQNAFIDTPEVERIVDFIAAQQGYPEPYWLPEVPDEKSAADDLDPNERDPLFEDAARLLVRLQTGSTSAIQQHLGIGYPRASRITLQLERAGIVGKPSGANRPRELLIQTDAELERYL